MGFLGVILTLIAGITNGSYPVPKNYCKNWQDSHVWSAFSMCAFLLIPLIILLTNLHALSFLSGKAFSILIIAGFFFSLGMACFTFSLRQIGLGPAFSLNIILNTSLGTLIPLFLFHLNEVFSKPSLLIYGGILLFTASIVFLYLSISHEKHTSKRKEKIYGIALGVLSGILTSMQSSAYNYAINELSGGEISQIFNKLAIWSVFFISSFPVFFLIHFLKLNKPLSSFKQFKFHNLKLITAMAVLYYLSILLFSWATNYITIPVAWPIFMTTIVLTTNIWSSRLSELQNIKKKLYAGYLATTLIAFLFFASSMNLGG